MDLIFDTQALSYRFKGIRRDIHSDNLGLSSISANEFLLAQPQNSDTPDYYTIHSNIFGLNFRYVKKRVDEVIRYFRDRNRARHGAIRRAYYRTDQVIIDFNNQFSAYREFGNEAIAKIINDNKPEIYRMSIAHLPKSKQKYLIKRLQFILDNGYYCYALTDSILEEALNLFSAFTSEHDCKGNIRNSVNDILILATAIYKEKKLLTYDNVLSRFAAKNCDAAIHQNEDVLLIDFSEEKVVERKKNRESKGYIHKGWSYTIRKN